MSRIRTPWYDKIDRSCPLSEYPRPQFERKDWLCLNGEYEYAITAEKAEAPEKFDGTILVPFSVESELSGVTKPLAPEQRLWYRRKFKLNDSFKNKDVLLHFEAVDWQCSVWVNGKHVGDHTGGYDPFTFDITELVNFDSENEITVKVFDPTDAGHQQRGKQVNETHGFWYTATSGIWQTVWLEPVCKNRINSIRLLPDIDKSAIGIKADLSGNGGKLFARITEEAKVIFEGEIQADSEILIENTKLWSPESPFLYSLSLTYECGGEKDEVSSYFGMRKFSIMNDGKGIPRLALNNRPYFQKGLLDQGYWPETQLTPPCDEAMIFDIQKMKDLGYNMLRKHIKVEPRRWYYHCDRIGMLVWQDMVSGGQYIGNVLAGMLPNLSIHVKDNMYKAFKREKPEWREEFKQELFAMIDNLYNSVSLCCWVPFNEGWGQFDAKEIGEKVKAYDPSRFVDHASGWHDQSGPDFKSMHRYIVPVTPPFSFTRKGRPYVLSEYGGYSWNIKDHVWNEKKSFGYIMFKDSKNLSKAYKNLHEKQIIPLIKKGLCATVYTQVSDVEFEVNGIYSYDRKVLKINAEMIKEINKKLTY